MINIIKKEMIVEVNGIKLFDIVNCDMVVGFSEDGKKVYVREVGDEGGVIGINEAVRGK